MFLTPALHCSPGDPSPPSSWGSARTLVPAVCAGAQPAPADPVPSSSQLPACTLGQPMVRGVSSMWGGTDKAGPLHTALSSPAIPSCWELCGGTYRCSPTHPPSHPPTQPPSHAPPTPKAGVSAYDVIIPCDIIICSDRIAVSPSSLKGLLR